MEEFLDSLIPLGICVVMPILIVWLRTRARQNETNKRTEIMLKAIESGATIDADFFKGQVVERRTLKERMLARLTAASVTGMLGIFGLVGGILFACKNCWDADDDLAIILIVLGGILLAVGLALFIVYLVGRRMLAKEIEAEEKALQQ